MPMTAPLPATKRVSLLPIAAIIVAAIAAMPILAIFWLALTGSTEGGSIFSPMFCRAPAFAPSCCWG